MEGWRRVATDFTYGLGSGLSAGSQNPTGRALRTSAGAGAILQQPMVLQKAREAMALQKQQEDARKAQILAGILGQQQQQAQQAKEHADAFGLQQKTFDLNKSNIEADNALAAKNADAKKLQDAEENRLKADEEARKWQTPLNPNEPIKSGGSQYYAYPNPQGGDPVLRKVGDTDGAAGPLTPDKVMVDGVGAEVLRDPKGNYFDVNTKQPITGRITPYIAPPNPRQKGEITPTAEANLMQSLNKQWDAAAKDVQSLYRANTIMNSGMEAARRGEMNAGAQAVLVTFQKFLDPTSVVRESEYARSGEGQSVANQVRGYVDKLERGGAGMTLPELEKFAKIEGCSH